jgi:glycosyltransferase involved in cell wall biosynthesis
VQPERNGLGRVDMKRKLYELMPRETVSACLIVRNGERTLKRCIESFIEYVDEVIIMIDPSTKDRTHEICAQIAKDYPLKPVIYEYGLEALKDGFDAARNRSIEGASGDWILWVDADEEIQQPWNLWQYLRPSMLPAVGFPQIHYSVAPAGVLTTDFPCRLFRNNRGIKFYGLVHEHPETAPGAAIKHATIRHDVQFLHCGYVDEKTRRERYHRNLPLVFKDVEKYPNRKLNNFLLLRDLAQGIVFEQEQVGGTLEDHPARAKRGIELFEKLLENEPVRMIVDAMKYYSVCVSVLGVGFDAYTSMKIAKEEAPDLKVDLTVEGRFYSRAHFQKLLTRLQEEATKHYESEYL